MRLICYFKNDYDDCLVILIFGYKYIFKYKIEMVWIYILENLKKDIVRNNNRILYVIIIYRIYFFFWLIFLDLIVCLIWYGIWLKYIKNMR